MLRGRRAFRCSRQCLRNQHDRPKRRIAFKRQKPNEKSGNFADLLKKWLSEL